MTKKEVDRALQEIHIALIMANRGLQRDLPGSPVLEAGGEGEWIIDTDREIGMVMELKGYIEFLEKDNEGCRRFLEEVSSYLRKVNDLA